MIINHTPSGPGGPSGPDPRRAKGAAHEPVSPAPAADRVSTERVAGLKAALAATPALRPEVVARGEILAVDPNYPPLQIIERVASLIAASQDPSETAD
jgi:hypothetical protein